MASTVTSVEPLAAEDADEVKVGLRGDARPVSKSSPKQWSRRTAGVGVAVGEDAEAGRSPGNVRAVPDALRGEDAVERIGIRMGTWFAGSSASAS